MFYPMGTVLQILVLILLIAMSSYFSASETAFMSVNRARLKTLSDDGDKKSSRILRLIDSFDDLLMAILVGNNIVNIASTAIATVLFTRLIGDMGATVSTVVMTVLVLIFGEVLPKSFAKEMPEKIAGFSAPFMSALTRLLQPVSRAFGKLKEFLHSRFPANADAEPSITEDELMTYVDEAEDDGGIDEHESALIRSAIEFHDRDVEEILTPRVEIYAIEDTATVDEIAAIYDETNYSRLPVYHKSIDNIIGVLHERDFYSKRLKGEFDLQKDLGSVVYVQGGLKISSLMRRLQLEKLHMAVVLDEFGGTLGIVTLEDVIEELVGEIWDEHDEVVEFFHKQGDGSTTVDAGANLNDMFEYFGWGEVPDTVDAVTASGWAIEKFGYIPKVGDALDDNGYHVVVTRADKRHILELKFEPAAAESNEDEQQK